MSGTCGIFFLILSIMHCVYKTFYFLFLIKWYLYPKKKVCAASSPTPNLRTDSCGQVSKYKKKISIWEQIGMN